MIVFDMDNPTEEVKKPIRSEYDTEQQFIDAYVSYREVMKAKEDLTHSLTGGNK